MLRFYIASLLLLTACKVNQEVLQEGPPVPVITFEKQTIDLGKIKRGEKRDMVFYFSNTGNANLLIELVTACKCTALDWTRGVIAPGQKGQISVTYDSTDQALGDIKKTIDIIANTDPIVVEAFFNVVIEL